jgi:putative transposase
VQEYERGVALVRAPCVLITDKLRSYAVGQAGDHARRRARQHKGLNNRAENSHQPTRRRERIAGRYSTDRVARNSIDDKLAVPLQALATINARRHIDAKKYTLPRRLSVR